MPRSWRLPGFASRQLLIARWLAAAYFALLTACDSSLPLVSSQPAPALYFVLDLGASTDSVGDAYGLVATAALAGDIRYLMVESVTAQRVSDGRSLALEIVPRSGLLHGREQEVDPPFTTDVGNLRLRAQGYGDVLGVRDLVPGDSVVLRIVAEGTLMSAAMRIPARPVPRVSMENGQRVLRWDGDAGTAVWVAAVGLFGRQVRDTVFNMDSLLSPFELEFADSMQHFQVHAYDANYAAFVVPPHRDRAGVSGGLGVVGAIVRSRSVALPPR